MVAQSSASASLKDYLKRYENKEDEENKKKKKKKKANPAVTGVVVVDEDPVWQKPVKLEEENDDSADEEKPQVDEDIEVKRMKRLELLKSKSAVGVISEDGSGWVSVSDTSGNLHHNDQNYDMSSPQKREARNDTPSPEPELKPSSDVGADLSPSLWPRKRHDTLSPEPDKKLTHSSKLDTKHLNNDDNIDISPPRKRRTRYDTPSPEPALKYSESGRDTTDMSPPRRRLKHHHIPLPETETMPSHASDPDLDLSPSRRSHSHKLSDYENNSVMPESSDISPPQRVHRSTSHQYSFLVSTGADLSPPRRSKRDRLVSDDIFSQQSNRCLNENDSSHLSHTDLSPPRKVRKESPSLKQRPKTGLITSQDVKEEIAKTKREESLRFNEMDPSMSGKGAEPIYRDKITGQRISKDQFLKSQKKEEKPKEKKLEWGKGLAQKREAEARLQELELEKEKPFARSRDDPDLDEMLKERVRWGDPMAHLVKRKHSEPILPDLGENEKMKESGFIVPQDIPNHSWLRRGLDAAPNRYGIKPGRHWDGVDRSNGFEKELFKRMNEKHATEREAYLWSVSDM